MFGSWTYLVWLGLFIGLPLAVLWARWRQALWRQRRALGWTLLGALVGGWLWDGVAIQARVWRYNPAYIAGVWWLGMPLEEWLWVAGVALMFGSLTVVLMARREETAG